MRIKTLTPYWIRHDDEDQSATRVVHLPMNRRQRRAALRDQRALHDRLVELEIIEPYGCRCSHCERDWDCCGLLFPGGVSIKQVRGGLRVSQHYPRNV